MSRDAILCITFGFVGGILARSFFDFGPVAIILFLCLSAIALTQSFLVYPERVQVWRAAALFFLFISLGILRFDLKDQSEFTQSIKRPESTIFLGLVVAEPDQRDNKTQLIFQPDNWPIKILLFVPSHPEFSYGDRLQAIGQLVPIKNFEAETSGRLVPYADYLAVSEIYYEMFDPKITLLKNNRGSWLKSRLFGWKTIWLERLAKTIPEPEASLLAGLTLGARQSLGTEWTERFRRAGLLHIVVLSGYNLSVVATAILIVLGFLSKRKRLVIAAVAIILFTIMVGAGPATLRACLMALIALLATATGRRYEAGWALGAAGFAMIVFNPKVLVFDSGFQLSFLATFGLISLAPRISTRLWFIKWPLARELITMTLSAQLAVFPWFLCRGMILSPLALPANLFVLPLVPPAMFFGFLTALLPSLAGLVWLWATPAWLLATYILAVTKFMAQFLI